MKRQYFCNPINVPYHYQFCADPRDPGKLCIGREAADPSMIFFQNRYYIFASMNLSVWVSEDLVHWESRPLPESLPLYDYAPDARVIGAYVYLCASSRDHKCNHYRTKDILHGPYEKITGDFDFWDPNLFCDDDGRVYFFWGCTNTKPIWGVEKDPVTMKNLGEPVGVIWGQPQTNGYERTGEDNSREPASPEEVEKRYRAFVKAHGADFPEEQLKKLSPVIRATLSDAPFIEGPWLTKYNGKYYLQYANPGAEYNVYNDGVYIADHPLGPYHRQRSNPFSYKPGGFLPGAGHGSTMWDRNGNLWHASTMRISKNFSFERRVGIWPAGFDSDGELFCNQRYGDWPLDVEEAREDPWREPAWYLLSYHAAMCASSSAEGRGPEQAVDENVQTWWQAGSDRPGEWLAMDLGEAKKVHFIQINFADEGIAAAPEAPIHPGLQPRWIDPRRHRTAWRLDGSKDGRTWVTLCDKTGAAADGDLSHDAVLLEEGRQLRFLKLTIAEVPFHQKPAVSGLRVFGIGNGSRPAVPVFAAHRTDDRDMEVKIAPQQDAVGFNILWGESPEKLYHSWMLFGKNDQRVGALVKGETYYVRVDAFNGNGITHGTPVKLQ